MSTPAGVKRFVNDDDAYLKWIEGNPQGFVVNSYKKPTPSYLLLHRATCPHIRTETNTNWTTTGYIKTCSRSVATLASWAEKEIGGNLEPCKICKPDLT